MKTLRCTMYSVRRTMYDVQCTTVHRTMYDILCIIYTVRGTVYDIHCIVIYFPIPNKLINFKHLPHVIYAREEYQMRVINIS